MENFKITFQKGSNILIQNIKANDTREAMYLFYMENKNVDILDIQKVR